MATAGLSPSGPVAPAEPQLSLHPPVGGKPGVAPSGTNKAAQKIEMVASPWETTAPEIKTLLENAMKLYTEKDPNRFHEALKQFAFNAEFDGPTFFFRGTERAKIFNYGFTHLFARVEVEPKVVRVTMLSDRLGLIELDAVLKLYPRQLLPRVWPISAVYPEVLPLHGTWSIVAKGDDDKVISMKERIHNLPTLPQLPRALASTAVTTGAMSLTLWP